MPEVTEWMLAEDAEPALIGPGETVATSEAKVKDGNVAIVLGIDEPLIVVEGTRAELATMAVRTIVALGLTPTPVPPTEQVAQWEAGKLADHEVGMIASVLLCASHHLHYEEDRNGFVHVCPECRADMDENGITALHDAGCPRIAGNS